MEDNIVKYRNLGLREPLCLSQEKIRNAPQSIDTLFGGAGFDCGL